MYPRFPLGLPVHSPFLPSPPSLCLVALARVLSRVALAVLSLERESPQPIPNHLAIDASIACSRSWVVCRVAVSKRVAVFRGCPRFFLLYLLAVRIAPHSSHGGLTLIRRFASFPFLFQLDIPFPVACTSRVLHPFFPHVPQKIICLGFGFHHAHGPPPKKWLVMSYCLSLRWPSLAPCSARTQTRVTGHPIWPPLVLIGMRMP